MKIFLNKNTHVGTDEPADKTKTWLPQNLTEEANFLSNPATYGVLSEPRVKIAEGLDAQNIDAYGEKFRVYEVEPSTLVIKEHKNGAWVNMELNLEVPETKYQLAIRYSDTMYYWEVDSSSAPWMSLDGKYDTTNTYYIHCSSANMAVNFAVTGTGSVGSVHSFKDDVYDVYRVQSGSDTYSVAETYYAFGQHSGGSGN